MVLPQPTSKPQVAKPQAAATKPAVTPASVAQPVRSASLSPLFNAKVTCLGLATLIGTVTLGTMFLQPALAGILGAGMTQAVIMGAGLCSAIWQNTVLTHGNRMGTAPASARNVFFSAAGFMGGMVGGYSVLSALANIAGFAAVIATPASIAVGAGIALLNIRSLPWRSSKPAP